MRGDLCQPCFLRLRSARFLAIHGERTQDLALPRKDRGRPAGTQSTNLSKLTIISPERICHNIGHHHWSSRVHGSATGTVAWSDRCAIYRFHISFGEIRRRAMTHMFPIPVQKKNGTTQSFRLAFHEKNKGGEHIRQRGVGRDHFQRAALSSAKKFFL